MRRTVSRDTTILTRRAALAAGAACAASLALPGFARGALAAKLPALTLYGPPAGPSIALAHAVASGALSAVAEQADFKVWRNPDEMRAGLTSGTMQALVLPVQVAARAAGVEMNAAGRSFTLRPGERVEVRFAGTAPRAGSAQVQAIAVAGTRTDAAAATIPVLTPATVEAFALHGSVAEGGPVVLPFARPRGVIEQFDTPQAIYARPATAFVLDFIGSVNYLPCRLAGADDGSVTLRWGDEAVVTLPRPPHLPPGPDVLLAARPESWRFAADGAGLPGTVVLRSFHGTGFEYRVRLGETEIRITTPNDVRVNEGETVRAAVSEGLLLEPDALSRPDARAA